jgi:hypothetical protein
MTEFRIKGTQGGIVEAEIKPKESKEAAIWLLHLLSHDKFIVKYNLKINSSGRAKIKVYFIARPDYQQIIADVQLKIAKLLNNS